MPCQHLNVKASSVPFLQAWTPCEYYKLQDVFEDLVRLVLAADVTLFCIVDGLSHYEEEQEAPHCRIGREALTETIRLMRECSNSGKLKGRFKVLMTAPRGFLSEALHDTFHPDTRVPEDALDLQWEEVVGEQLDANYGSRSPRRNSWSSSEL